jgi:hypothetical protein
MAAKKRVHVQDLTWQDRLLCGRPSYGQEIVSLPAAMGYKNLCNKCRDRLGLAWMLLATRAQVKPGLQLTLFQEW